MKNRKRRRRAPYTKDQPQHNDVVIHCGHLGARKTHFWKCERGLEFSRPDGTRGTAQWIVCCDRCFKKAHGDPEKVLIRGDAQWIGDEPIIRKHPKPEV